MKYSVKWYLLSAVIFMMIAALILLLFTNMEELDTVGIVTLSFMPFIMLGVFIYISSLELNIKIDTHGFSYQLIPIFNQWTHISKSDVITYEVKGVHSSMSTQVHSKNKIRWIGKNKRFFLLGKHILELHLANEKKIIFSTLHPEKIKEAIQQMILNHK